MARLLLCEIYMKAYAVALVLLALSARGAHPAAFGSPAGTGDEPEIAEVQQRAIEHARLEPSEISSWKKRARLQALLPQFQVEYERRIRDFVDININDSVYVGSNGVIVGPDEGSYSYNNNADQNVVVKAVWSLNETIFNPDILNVSAETRRLAGERQAILAEVTRNYFDRQRLIGEIEYLQDELKRSPSPEKIRHEIYLKRVSFSEATAALDALTGGWFSEQIRGPSSVGSRR